MSNVIKRINLISNESYSSELLADLKKCFEASLKNLEKKIETQNEAIMEALATQKVLTESLLRQEKAVENIKNTFPIKNLQSLSELNTVIEDANRELYSKQMKNILRGRLSKTLTSVIDSNLIIDINLDGIHGKKRLKDFGAFYGILLDAVRSLYVEEPEKKLRDAMRVVKKRNFHAVCLRNKKN